MSSLTICTYNVHSFYDEAGRCRVTDIAKLIIQINPDIVCLQESDGMHLKKLVKLLEDGPRAFTMVKWGGCSLLSALPMEEVVVESRARAVGLPGRRSYHPRFVTARVEVGEGRTLAVTCLHLDHKLEPRRMKEVAIIQEQLSSVFKSGEPQVWAGDFNALSKWDYSEEDWREVREVRARGGWELPQTEVTTRMASLGFTDSWGEVGRPGPTSTCRFNTHIDYVYMNGPGREVWRCEEVEHHPSTMSDHKMVIAKFTLIQGL